MVPRQRMLLNRVAAFLIAVHLLAPVAQAARFKRPRGPRLRTGEVLLGDLAGEAEAGEDASVSVQQAAGAAYRDAAAWGPAPSMRLYLVGSDPRRPGALQQALAARGAYMVSYIPDDTWLVAATPHAMREVALELGVRAARYPPRHKLDPEWEPLLLQLGGPAATQQGQLEDQVQQQEQVQPGGEPGGAASEPDGAARGAARRLTEAPEGVRAEGGEPGGGEGGAAAEAAAAAAAAVDLESLRTLDEAPLPQPEGGEAGGGQGVLRRRLAAGPGSVQYEVSVDLLPVVPAAALMAAERDWPAALAAAVGLEGDSGGGDDSDGGSGDSDDEEHSKCWPVVAAPRDPLTGRLAGYGGAGGHGGGGSPELSVFLCGKHLARGVRWLSRQEVVRWVAPRKRIMQRNAVATIVLETGDMNRTLVDRPLSGPGSGARPYRDAGLDGSGEVVGVGDTGLDLDSCYFADPRFANFSGMAGGAVRRWAPEGHRKVAQYVVAPNAAWGDEEGHGTHTCGSVAGARLSSPSAPLGPTLEDAATGAGPRTRLSFVDVTPRPSSGFAAGSMLVPTPLDTAYLPLHAAVGAGVGSDSWGADNAFYDRDSRGFDAYLWRNPGYVAFVAAGNKGWDGLPPGGTVASPATAKSPVAVGGTYQQPPAAGQATVDLWAAARNTAFRLIVLPYENRELPRLSSLLPVNKQVRLVVASPLDACASLTNPRAQLSGAVVLVAAAGPCALWRKARAVQAAGGAAVIFVNTPSAKNEAPHVYLPGTQANAVGFPVSLLSAAMGAYLLGNASAGADLTLTRTTTPMSFNNVAYFSAMGPTLDGRIKPDIVAPGFDIVSSINVGGITGGSCSSATASLTGTSMATPLAAGHAALIRQYFREGYYPSGARADAASSPFVPSGILIKAVTIAGAKSLEGGMHMGLGWRMGPAPDGFQGWGRMSLAGSLPLHGYSDPRVRLQVADWGAFTAAGQQHAMGGLTATGTGPITIVLAWYDYPAEPNAATALLNDLDLTVELAPPPRGEGGAEPEAETETELRLGNSKEGADFSEADRVNTVERVLLARPPPGARLVVTVRAAALPSAALDGPDAQLPQRWAVAVVGHFSGTLQSELNPALSKGSAATAAAAAAARSAAAWGEALQQRPADDGGTQGAAPPPWGW